MPCINPGLHAPLLFHFTNEIGLMRQFQFPSTQFLNRQRIRETKCDRLDETRPVKMRQVIAGVPITR